MQCFLSALVPKKLKRNNVKSILFKTKIFKLKWAFSIPKAYVNKYNVKMH